MSVLGVCFWAGMLQMLLDLQSLTAAPTPQPRPLPQNGPITALHAISSALPLDGGPVSQTVYAIT